MIDVIVVTVIVLAVGLGGLYVAGQPVPPSKREVREIEILECLKRTEEWMKQYATTLLPIGIPASSASCSTPFHNREILENSRVCGCSNCLQVFVPELIKRWTDGEQTACCPFCGVPAVVSDPDGVSLNVVTLLIVHRERSGWWPEQPAWDAKPSPG